MVKWFEKHFTDPKREPVLIDYVRTPLGSKKGTLRLLRGDNMLIHVIKTLYNRNKDTIDFEEVGNKGLGDVIAGCCAQIGSCALDVARNAEIAAGMPPGIPGVTVNRHCASGMQANIFAWQQIASCDKDVVLAGGIESQNTYPIMADMNVANGGPGGINITVPPNPHLGDSPYVQESYKKYAQYEPEIRGQIYSAEILGRLYRDKSGLSPEAFRSELDQLSVASHQKAGDHFDDRALEIEPIETPITDEKGEPIVDIKGEPIPGKTQLSSKDESVRPTAGMLEKISTLPGLVKKKSGILTAANSCPTTDGAACNLWTSREYAEEHSLKIRGSLESYFTIGTDAVLMLTGPIEAIPGALKRADLTLDDMSVIEINEAFSTVVYASAFDLGFDWRDERFNRWGGAIAIGHPTGMSGCRLIGTTLTQLEQMGKDYGVASLCVGFGMGIAVVVKRE